MVKKRYDYIDLLKCIAMFMVISLHTDLWHTDFIKSDTIATIVQYCLRLIMEGVPIFVLINGFLIVGRENLDLKKHYCKVLKLFVLFLGWAIICYVSISLIKGNSVNLKDLFDGIINTKIGSKHTGHLWFLQNLIALYLIYPIINNIKNKDLYNYFLLIVTFFAFVPSFIDLLFPGNSITIFINRFCPSNNLIFIFYFLFGGFIKNNINQLKNHRLLLIIVGLIIYILSCILGIEKSYNNGIMFSNNFLYSQIALSFIIAGLIMIFINYKNHDKIYNKFIKSVASNTLGIYLIHPIIIAVLLTIFKNVQVESFAIRFVYSSFVFFISYIVIYIISKIPYLKKIVEL